MDRGVFIDMQDVSSTVPTSTRAMKERSIKKKLLSSFDP
jgi:hypothetical protein